MQYIFVHGLGQLPDSWELTLAALPVPATECHCPDLPRLLQGRPAVYNSLYAAFCGYCGAIPGPAVLCGLSLGAVLALQYAIDFPARVQALALIAPQYKVPAGLLRAQDVVFRFMPRRAFAGSGFQKEGFRSLARSMATLDFSASLGKAACPALVLCGEKDKANRKAAESLARLLPRGELVVVSGAGHEVNRGQPQRLAGVLAPFFAACQV